MEIVLNFLLNDITLVVAGIVFVIIFDNLYTEGQPRKSTAFFPCLRAVRDFNQLPEIPSSGQGISIFCKISTFLKKGGGNAWQ